MKRIFKGAILGMAVMLAMGAAPAWAADERLTFTKDILPILQENCQTCHRPAGMNLSGMIAPMSLMTYQEVRPWAKAIARVVEAKEMPPWHASEAQHGIFRNERTLTAEEIDMILRWVEQRAPRGNPKDSPEPVQWPDSGWNFGTPDLVVEFDEPFFVPDEIEDLYHDVEVQLSEEQLPNDRWIKGIEFKPGSEVVHHLIAHAYAPGQDRSDRSQGMLGGNAPGADQVEFEEGYGIMLRAGSSIAFDMHYHKESGPGTGMFDSSQIGIQFHPEDKPVTHPVSIYPIAHRAFEIPPYHGSWRVGAAQTLEEDMTLLGMLPHTHLRGSYAKYTAFYPDGTSEVLLEVPEYDFNWQTGYNFAEPKFLPAGTRLEMDLHFDNSVERAERIGFNPARAVSFGGPTTDEMDLAWLTIAPTAEVHPGD